MGVASCLLITMFVVDEFSYDTFHENANNIYKIVLERRSFSNSPDATIVRGRTLQLNSNETHAWDRYYTLGDNAREVELMAEVFGSPADALRAATSDAARVLGRDDLGRIAPGCAADLVALEADPLADAHALRRVVLVVRDGRVVLDRRPRR